jgi:hypothetical protein
VNEELVGEALVRNHIAIATKLGFKIDGTNGLDSRPERIRRVVAESLKRLKSDRIDLYYQHRVDLTMPIEDAAGTFKDLIQQSKVLHFGRSEPSARTIRLPHAGSWSAAWSATACCRPCEELGIGFVPWPDGGHRRGIDPIRGWVAAVVVPVGLWGLMATAAPVGWWSWFAEVMPHNAEAGGGLMVAVIQLAIALGSAMGGLLFDSTGYKAPSLQVLRCCCLRLFSPSSPPVRKSGRRPEPRTTLRGTHDHEPQRLSQYPTPPGL